MLLLYKSYNYINKHFFLFRSWVEGRGARGLRGSRGFSRYPIICIEAQLAAEWVKFKYDILRFKNNIPKDMKDQTPTEWLMISFVRQTTYFQIFPDLTKVAEIALALPVSNAWPERGACKLKLMKTRLRNRLSNKMLNYLMQVSINGKQFDQELIITNAVKHWINEKNPNVPQSVIHCSQSDKTHSVTMKSRVKECVLPEDTSPGKCFTVIPFNTNGCEDNGHTDKETAIKMFGLDISDAGDEMSDDEADTDSVTEFEIGDVDYVPT